MGWITSGFRTKFLGVLSVCRNIELVLDFNEAG
jgi:hypothetical protein